MPYLLSIVIFIPFLGGLILFIFPFEKFFRKSNVEEAVRYTGFLISLFTFFLSIFLWVFFDNTTSSFQFIDHFSWSSTSNFQVSFGVDGISLFLILLTTLFTPLALLCSWDFPVKGKVGLNYNGVREQVASFLIMESFILIVFTALDLLVFYVFFESVLIPMFLIIGIQGSRERKIRATQFFFFQTLLGSVLMLLALLLIQFEMGTTDYQLLMHNPISENKQYLLWLAFFASFAVKVPMMPVHIWLPEAHVEAPTAGSVILAAILLKLGTQGLIRFSLPLFPVASIQFTPLVYAMALVAIVYTSLTAIRQSDIKRIIAQASVAHINVTLVGLFSLTSQGVEGSILQMLSHGLVAGALFLCVGVIQDRHHSRMVKYQSGLAHTIPLYVTIFLFFTIANIALPGTSSFVGEFLILLGTFQVNTFAAVIAATGMILGGAYSLWLYNRVAQGNLKVIYTGFSTDLSRREFFTFLPLVILTLIIGIQPEIFLNPMHTSCTNLIDFIESPSSF